MTSALIPKDKITEPKAATELAAVASVAEIEIEYAAICREVNTATNCGQTSCIWQSGIQQENLNKLAAKGITVTEVARQAHPGRQLKLSWV